MAVTRNQEIAELLKRGLIRWGLIRIHSNISSLVF